MAFDLLNGMQWSTFFGGQEDDTSYGVAIDRHSNALYYAGETTSTQSQLFPLSPWELQSYFEPNYAGGIRDGYLARFSVEDLEDIVTDIDDEYMPETARILLIPNPANSIVQVFVPNMSSATVVEIIDLQGKLVDSIPVSTNHDYVTLDVSQLSSGVYLVRIPGSNIAPEKLIVQ